MFATWRLKHTLQNPAIQYQIKNPFVFLRGIISKNKPTSHPYSIISPKPLAAREHAGLKNILKGSIGDKIKDLYIGKEGLPIE